MLKHKRKPLGNKGKAMYSKSIMTHKKILKTLSKATKQKRFSKSQNSKPQNKKPHLFNRLLCCK